MLLVDNGSFVPQYPLESAMTDEPMHHHLLTPLEAELLACYRAMDEQGQAATAYMMAAQSTGRQNIAAPVRLSLVGKE